MRLPIQRFYYTLCALLLVIAFMSQTTEAQKPKQTSTGSIVAGKSAGQVKIGDTKNQVFQLYPRLKRSDYYE